MGGNGFPDIILALTLREIEANTIHLKAKKLENSILRIVRWPLSKPVHHTQSLCVP